MFLNIDVIFTMVISVVIAIFIIIPLIKIILMLIGLSALKVVEVSSEISNNRRLKAKLKFSDYWVIVFFSLLVFGVVTMVVWASLSFINLGNPLQYEKWGLMFGIPLSIATAINLYKNMKQEAIENAKKLTEKSN